MKTLAIVHEHRNALDVKSWGGFALYPFLLRKNIFEKHQESMTASMLYAGDRLMWNRTLTSRPSKIKKVKNRTNSDLRSQKIVKLKEILKSHDFKKPNLIYHQFNSFQLPNDEIIALSSEFNIKLVTTLVDLQEKDYPQNFSSEQIKRRDEAYSINFGLASRIISISDFLVKDLQKLGITNVAAVHVPLGANHFADEKSATNLKHLVPFDKPYLLFPAKAWKHKNHLELLHSMTMGNFPNELNLILLGNTSAIDSELRNYKKKLPQLFAYNYVNEIELKFLYENAHALIFPSTYEGFGLPYLEASYYGKPTLAFKNKSSIEIFGNDYELLVNEGDFQSLFSNAQKLYENRELYREYSSRSKTIAENYTWEKTAIGTLEVYEALVEELRSV